MNLTHLNLRVRDPGACRTFYERHFGFHYAFDADDGYFLRNDDGFLLALVPADPHQPLPVGFHIGFALAAAGDVVTFHGRLARELGSRRQGPQESSIGALEDFRPTEDYVTFRCWDPDATEIEVYWDGS